MNRKFLLISLLYAVPTFAKEPVTHQEDQIVLEGLGTLDSMGIVNVVKIVEFCDLTERFIEHQIKTHSGEHYNLKQLVDMADMDLLTSELQTRFFKLYTERFLKISHPYFNEIRHLKPILVKLLSTWAHQRNRTDSSVLLWASIESGKEEQFVKEYTPTLKAFYTFLVDIDMLLQDIIHSCPKAYTKYREAKKLVEDHHSK